MEIISNGNRKAKNDEVILEISEIFSNDHGKEEIRKDKYKGKCV